VLPIHEMLLEARTAPAGSTCRRTARYTLRSNNGVEALDKLARHLDLLEPEVTVVPSGPATVNFTETYLDELTRDAFARAQEGGSLRKWIGNTVCRPNL
jgi:hypothetical protein